MKDTTRRLLLTMMILLGLLVVDNLLATPNGQCALTLSVNGGDAIQPRDLPNSCQWCSTPGSNPTSAVTSGGHTWNGTQGLGAACAGSPCGENSIHWVLTNANPPFLTISNQCKPEECKPKTQCDACGTTEPDGCGGEKAAIPSQETADAIYRELQAPGTAYRVTAVTRKEKRRNPVAPFTTSKLQQEAARKLRFTAKKTMMVAQQL